MASSLDERLSRIELMLSEIIDRLVELEMRLRASEEAVIAGELVGWQTYQHIGPLRRRE